MDVLINSEIILYGAVGESFFEDGFTARDVINALAKLRGKAVTVRVNSGGGFVDEGVAIYNSLKNHDGKVTVFIDGVAASAASLIAVAGAETVMRTGAVMMVHDPMFMTVGNAKDHEKSVEALNATADSMADIYAEKSGRKAAEIRAEMREELWLTPDDAITKGYADRKSADEAMEAAAFDYRAYAKTPERILAISDARQWSNRLKAHRPKATTQETQQMAGETVTKEAAAAQAEASAIEAATKARTDEASRASEIVALCTKAGEPAMAAALIREGVSLDQAKAKIEGAESIRKAVALARKSCPQIDAAFADQMIAAGASLDRVRADLFEKMAAVQAVKPTRSQFGQDDGDRRVAKMPTPTEIYARRREARSKMGMPAIE